MSAFGRERQFRLPLEAALRAKRAAGYAAVRPKVRTAFGDRTDFNALRSDLGLFGDFQGVVHLYTESRPGP